MRSDTSSFDSGHALVRPKRLVPSQGISWPFNVQRQKLTGPGKVLQVFQPKVNIILYPAADPTLASGSWLDFISTYPYDQT